jgi:DNA-directed RNA polymerase specialized sigma24 family protein
LADRVALEGALAALPLRARQAVVARHVLGFDGPHSATLLGVSPDAFRQILSRAMKALRLSPELVEEP